VKFWLVVLAVAAALAVLFIWGALVQLETGGR